MKLRDFAFFLAGFEFFHTISHIALPYLVKLPISVYGMILTPMMNNWVIGINAAITIVLLWWASRLKR